MTKPSIALPTNPVLMFFQEVKDGDVRKHSYESNDSDSGGGARDLRIRPESKFWTAMASFFPQTVSMREKKGLIYSQTTIDSPPEVATISFMSSTTARPGECRICKIGEIVAWRIDPDQMAKTKALGHRWFYLLILDDSKNVWASKFSTEVLTEMHPLVQTAINSAVVRLNGRTIRGLLTINTTQTL